MRSCSIPGQLYSIDATSVNQGIPYADSFFVMLHYCMKKTVDDSTVMSVHAQIKYKKSVWGVIKGFIEKNTWLGEKLSDFLSFYLSSLSFVSKVFIKIHFKKTSVKFPKKIYKQVKKLPTSIILGLEEFYEALSKQLQTELNLPRPKGRRTRKGSGQPQMATNSLPALPPKQFQHNTETVCQTTTAGSVNSHMVPRATNVGETEKTLQNNRQETFSWVVIFLLISLIAFNVILYVKLWRLDEHQETNDNDFLGHRMEFLR